MPGEGRAVLLWCEDAGFAHPDAVLVLFRWPDEVSGVEGRLGEAAERAESHNQPRGQIQKP